MRFEASKLFKAQTMWVVLFLAISWASIAVADGEWLIVPGESVGKITKTTSYENLKATYGEENITDGVVHLGEGQTSPATILYPDQSDKTLKIVWRDSSRTEPSYIEIQSKGSRWQTKEGIAIGFKLKELEKLNGASITLAGFRWDHGGIIRSYNNGALKKVSSMGLRIALKPNSEMEKLVRSLGVAGDKSFLSTEPNVQKLDPEVRLIMISFN